jgi:hypothetical protein
MKEITVTTTTNSIANDVARLIGTDSRGRNLGVYCIERRHLGGRTAEHGTAALVLVDACASCQADLAPFLFDDDVRPEVEVVTVELRHIAQRGHVLTVQREAIQRSKLGLTRSFMIVSGIERRVRLDHHARFNAKRLDAIVVQPSLIEGSVRQVWAEVLEAAIRSAVQA